MLIAVQNAQFDLRAGFTTARDMTSHGNGYGDVAIRNAINEGRIDGPRYQVSTRGIVWGAKPKDPAHPEDPLAAAVVRSPEEARAAVRDQIAHGADWIKLYPAGAYSFSPTGKDEYDVTYPLPVLQAAIDEAHRLGHKTGCHNYGGEGLQNAIVAGCDTIEHGFGLDQDEVNMMVAKGLYFDPTLVRYTEPYMDDNDAKNTGGKYRMIPIFEHAVQMAAATQGLKLMVGSGVDGATFAHGTQALEFEALVQGHGMVERTQVIQAGNHDQRRSAGLAGPDRLDRQGQVRRSDRGFRRSAGRHHRTPAREIRDEGRQDHSQRSGARLPAPRTEFLADRRTRVYDHTEAGRNACNIGSARPWQPL